MTGEVASENPTSGLLPESDPIMMAHYQSGAELGRLESRNALEFERSKVILTERLPAEGRLIDVGGGPGTYSAWFASRGYQVDLVDPVPLHVEVARKASAAGAHFGAQLGDARQLPFADSVADGVVMMGPLFHLVTAEDRHRALREAFRVLRPEGVIAASAMGRFFLFGHAVAQNTIRDPEILSRVTSIVATGDRPGEWGPFPAFAHRPKGAGDRAPKRRIRGRRDRRHRELLPSARRSRRANGRSGIQVGVVRAPQSLRNRPRRHRFERSPHGDRSPSVITSSR